MCVHVCIICVYIYMYVCIDIYIYMYVCIYIYLYILMCIFVQVHLSFSMAFVTFPLLPPPRLVERTRRVR